MPHEKQTALAPNRAALDPFAMLRQMTAEFDRVFRPSWSTFRWPSLERVTPPAVESWSPQIDVFERDNRLVTKVDLPGMKKEDVKQEVTDGHLAISGERKSETEENKENIYRSERSYGSFYRAVPLPDGVKLEDVKATFAGGVLEVSVPLPSKGPAKVRNVEVQDGAKQSTAAA